MTVVENILPGNDSLGPAIFPFYSSVVFSVDFVDYAVIFPFYN